MYDRKKLKRKLYKKGWRQYWGRGHDKWVYRKIIEYVLPPYLWLYAVSWREALMIEYKR